MLTGATAVHTLEATGVGDGDTVLVHGRPAASDCSRSSSPGCVARG